MKPSKTKAFRRRTQGGKNATEKFQSLQGLSADVYTLKEPHASAAWVAKVLPARERQCLAMALNTTGPSMNSVDLSDNVNRLQIGKAANLCQVLPQGRIYLAKQRRVLHGKEALKFQSYPINLINEQSSEVFADLAAHFVLLLVLQYSHSTW